MTCYNAAMRHLFKEIGKYFFDLSKIILALAVITPIVKGVNITVGPLLIAGVLFAVGAIFTYSGGKEDE